LWKYKENSNELVQTKTPVEGTTKSDPASQQSQKSATAEGDKGATSK